MYRSFESFKADAEKINHDFKARPYSDNEPSAMKMPLRGRRAAVVTFSPYPFDPRPRRDAEALVGEGMSVDVICITEDGKDLRRETFNGVNILRIPIIHRRRGAFGYVYQYSLFILICFGILAVRSIRRRYQLVHIHNMPDILVLSALIPKAFGAKVLLDLHDPMPELMMTIFNLQERSFPVQAIKKLEKWSIAVADAVITVNRTFQRLFISRSCPPDKIYVVMNSPDEDIFKFHSIHPRERAADEKTKRFVIMYHGTLVQRNGVQLAVEAMARVRNIIPTAELRIYGHHTPLLERLMGSATWKSLGEAVRYYGPRRSEQLVKEIKECDIGIIPNERSIFTELNTPVRIFEYLALGKPVIAPRAPGIEDYFNDKSLLMFELGDTEDLALKLAHVFFHPDEALEVVIHGQEVYLAHTWRQERRRLVNIVAELLSNGQRE